MIIVDELLFWKKKKYRKKNKTWKIVIVTVLPFITYLYIQLYKNGRARFFNICNYFSLAICRELKATRFQMKSKLSHYFVHIHLEWHKLCLERCAQIEKVNIWLSLFPLFFYCTKNLKKKKHSITIRIHSMMRFDGQNSLRWNS